MADALYYAGLGLIPLKPLALWLTPYETFQARFDRARTIGLARSKIVEMPWRIASGVVFVMTSGHAGMKWFWLMAGIFSLLSALLWIVAAIPPGRPYEPSPGEPTGWRLLRQHQVTASLSAAILLGLWLYSWHQ